MPVQASGVHAAISEVHLYNECVNNDSHHELGGLKRGEMGIKRKGQRYEEREALAPRKGGGGAERESRMGRS